VSFYVVHAHDHQGGLGGQAGGWTKGDTGKVAAAVVLSPVLIAGAAVGAAGAAVYYAGKGVAGAISRLSRHTRELTERRATEKERAKRVQDRAAAAANASTAKTRLAERRATETKRVQDRAAAAANASTALRTAQATSLAERRATENAKRVQDRAAAAASATPAASPTTPPVEEASSKSGDKASRATSHDSESAKAQPTSHPRDPTRLTQALKFGSVRMQLESGAKAVDRWLLLTHTHVLEIRAQKTPPSYDQIDDVLLRNVSAVGFEIDARNKGQVGCPCFPSTSVRPQAAYSK
jgi:hypothetical protein